MRVVRHKWGKIGPSDHLNENGDLSFFIVFFETVLGREHSGNVSKKNCSATFISGESP